MLGSSGRLGNRIVTRGAWLFAWLTLALLMALFVNVPLGLCADMPLDAGFEAGVDGTSSVSVWTPSGSGLPERRLRRHRRLAGRRWARSTRYVKGPASTQYADLTAAAPISTDDSSITFWVYIDAHQNYRYILGSFWCGATIGTYWLRTDSTGNLTAYTSKTGITGYPKGAYTPIGDHPHGLDPAQDHHELHLRHLHLLDAPRHRRAPGCR